MIPLGRRYVISIRHPCLPIKCHMTSVASVAYRNVAGLVPASLVPVPDMSGNGSFRVASTDAFNSQSALLAL